MKKEKGVNYTKKGKISKIKDGGEKKKQRKRRVKKHKPPPKKADGIS